MVVARLRVPCAIVSLSTPQGYDKVALSSAFSLLLNPSHIRKHKDESARYSFHSQSTTTTVEYRNKKKKKNNISTMNTTETEHVTVGEFCTQLAQKQPTPGGGAAAAVAAAVGSAAAHMAAAYTQRKTDETSGAADHARILQAIVSRATATTLESESSSSVSSSTPPSFSSMLAVADDDARAYRLLQTTWKPDSKTILTKEELLAIRDEALRVPTDLVISCHAQMNAIVAFLPHCNPHITSDAKVGLHLLAGAARAAYQTALVNIPPPELKEKLDILLWEMRDMEDNILRPAPNDSWHIFIISESPRTVDYTKNGWSKKARRTMYKSTYWSSCDSILEKPKEDTKFNLHLFFEILSFNSKQRKKKKYPKPPIQLYNDREAQQSLSDISSFFIGRFLSNFLYVYANKV
jgi:methenyltetrahydrofolate cyclohydrolase